MDFDGATKDQITRLYDLLLGNVLTDAGDGSFSCRDVQESEFYALYGGLLFLGLFLGLLFLMATVLIIYYKQISEGYEDKERFAILEKVGMSQQQVRTAIRSQVRMVFFLPLLGAIIHLAASFKMISKLMSALGLQNIPLFALCCAGTVAAFAVGYFIIYHPHRSHLLQNRPLNTPVVLFFFPNAPTAVEIHCDFSRLWGYDKETQKGGEQPVYRIYLVEDDQVIAATIGEKLTAWGFTVRCAENFSDILGEFASFQPHLVLMDITLPFYNGYHWCQEIRRVSQVPILFLSSASDNINIVMAINMGADDFIAKPFDLSVLLAKVQAALRRAYMTTRAEPLGGTQRRPVQQPGLHHGL